MSATTYRLFLGVTPGLEAQLAAEVEARVGVAGKRLEGGVELRAPREALWTLAHDVRQAESLRLRLGRFEAHNFDDLQAGARKLPWAAYLSRDAAPAVKASCHRSALYHSDAVAERVRDAVAARLNGAGSEAAPTIHVRLQDDVAELSLDVGVERMHRRGWREHSSSAPLRESLAASLLALAAWRPGDDLWDPFCGAGTIPLEAADTARGGPARGGSFGFESWPTHDLAGYGEWLLERARSRREEPANHGQIGGSDRSEKAIAAACHNRRLAQLDEVVSFARGDLRDEATTVPDDALVVSNLPYGKRIPDAVAEGCLRTLTQRQRARAGGAVVLTGTRWQAPAQDNGWELVASFANRGLPVVALRWRG